MGRQTQDSRFRRRNGPWWPITVRVGAESFTNTAQGQISYESLAEILEAFLAAYAIARRSKKSPLDFVYLMTLPGDKQVEAKG